MICLFWNLNSAWQLYLFLNGGKVQIFILRGWLKPFQILDIIYEAQPVKLDLNKKLDPKQKTIQAFNIDA